MTKHDEEYEIDPQTRFDMNLRILARIIARDYTEKRGLVPRSKITGRDGSGTDSSAKP